MEEMQNHWETKYKSKNYYEETPMISLQFLGELEDDNIIDTGAGTSALVDTLLNQGKKMAVLDISEESLAINQQRLGVESSSKNKQDLINYKMNALVSIKPGGFLLVGTFSMDTPAEYCRLPIYRYSEETLFAFFVSEFEQVYTKSFEGVNGSAPFILAYLEKK